jgi:hypothetical protein
MSNVQHTKENDEEPQKKENRSTPKQQPTRPAASSPAVQQVRATKCAVNKNIYKYAQFVFFSKLK